MTTTHHRFASPEEALAFMAGVRMVNDPLLDIELGPTPVDVTVIDHGADPETSPGDPDYYTIWADRRLQVDEPIHTFTEPEEI